MKTILQMCIAYLTGIALPASEPVLDTVPLEDAALCQNCGVITRYRTQHRCPLCDSEAVIKIEPIVNSQRIPSHMSTAVYFEQLPGSMYGRPKVVEVASRN
jgi:hypothetical protein